jgi:hypothetical protein
MSRRETACPCGKGIYVTITEGDDWNRFRSSTEICCPICAKKSTEVRRLIAKHEEACKKFISQAERLAQTRYLSVFIAQFSGQSKKTIWKTLFAGKSYPSLGTFYTHVSIEGVDEYLKQHFLRELDSTVSRQFRDAEIESLLKQADAEKAAMQRVERDNFAYLPRDT